MRTRYDFNKQKFCKGLTGDKLKALGSFTNRDKSFWFYDKVISPIRSYGGISFYVSIKLDNIEESEIDIIDNSILQPYTPVVHYYLNKREYEDLSDYAKKCVYEADKIIQWLIDNNIIYFEK